MYWCPGGDKTGQNDMAQELIIFYASVQPDCK